MLKETYAGFGALKKEPEKLKKLFSDFRGKLINPCNGRKLNKHEGVTDKSNDEDETNEIADTVEAFW